MEIKDLTVGDVVKFGRYPQSRDTDGKGFVTEPIEWLVLGEEDDCVLLISKHALDCRLYHNEGEATTWARCSLRAWLNGFFLESAFDEAERRGIAKRTVVAHRNPEQETNPGEDTEDKIFLLSVRESERYFYFAESGACAPTEYAKGEGVYVADDGNCKFWLRSPGFLQDEAAYVGHDGCVSNHGDYVLNGDSAVRPAMWVSLETLSAGA